MTDGVTQYRTVMTDGVPQYRTVMCFVFITGQELTCVCRADVSAAIAENKQKDLPDATAMERLVGVLNVLGGLGYSPAPAPSTTAPNTTVMAFAKLFAVTVK